MWIKVIYGMEYHVVGLRRCAKFHHDCQRVGFAVTAQRFQSLLQEGLAVASIARDVGSSSTNCSSDIMHFLPRLLKKTLQHKQL